MTATLETIRPRPVRYQTVTRGPGNNFRMALEDVISGLAMWPLWMQLGWNDILQRYRRSMLGPFWLTASMMIMVISLGIIYAELFQTPIDDFLPFLAVGLLVWTLISSFLTEGGTMFTSLESYIKQVRLPYSVYIFRSAWSKLIIFAHNAVIYLGVLVYFGIWPGAVILLAIPGLALVLLNGALANLCVGMASARFRDIPQLITSVMQIIFFVTPIFWMPGLLKSRTYVIDYNPFYHLIEIVRAPMLGSVPDTKTWIAVGIITFVNLVVCGLFFVRFRARISYWV